MNHWLIKTEPGTWSWDDQVRDKRTHWDGVRNHQAAGYLKAMAKGDRCFFYHSVKEKRIVGVVEVVRTYYPDPSDKTGKGFGMVDVEAVEPLPEPVTLAQIKEDPSLRELPLVRQSRLSVMPIPAPAWKKISRLGGLKG